MQFNVCSLTIFYTIKNPKLEYKKCENTAGVPGKTITPATPTLSFAYRHINIFFVFLWIDHNAWRILRIKIEPDAEIGEKDGFRSGTI